MRRGILVLLVGVALAVSGCSGGHSGTHYRFSQATKVGQTIALGHRKPGGGFTGPLLGGGTFTLAKDAGAVTVINFWATDCSPCVTETPQFDRIYRAYRSKGVQFVGIDTKEFSRGKSVSWVRARDISYPMVWDEVGATALAIGHLPATALPFTVLLDRQRRVAAVYVGMLTAPDLDPVLDRLLAE